MWVGAAAGVGIVWDVCDGFLYVENVCRRAVQLIRESFLASEDDDAQADAEPAFRDVYDV